MSFRMTDGSRDNRTSLDDMTATLEGKVFADQGYLSQLLLESLWQRGLHWVTGIRRKMKNHLMPLLDKVVLRKQFSIEIESLFEVLKSKMGLEPTRHRFPHPCPRPCCLQLGRVYPGTTQSQNGQSRHPCPPAPHPQILLILSRIGVGIRIVGAAMGQVAEAPPMDLLPGALLPPPLCIRIALPQPLPAWQGGKEKGKNPVRRRAGHPQVGGSHGMRRCAAECHPPGSGRLRQDPQTTDATGCRATALRGVAGSAKCRRPGATATATGARVGSTDSQNRHRASQSCCPAASMPHGPASVSAAADASLGSSPRSR